MVLVFRLRMLSSKLYRKGAIKSEHNLCPVSLLVAQTTLSKEGYHIIWFSRVTGGHSLVHVVHGMAKYRPQSLPFFDLHRFLYDFVAFPNVIFSGTIISSVIHNGDIKKTAEWQLLLSSITFPGIFIGALLCNPLGRRNTVGSLLDKGHI